MVHKTTRESIQFYILEISAWAKVFSRGFYKYSKLTQIYLRYENFPLDYLNQFDVTPNLDGDSFLLRNESEVEKSFDYCFSAFTKPES